MLFRQKLWNCGALIVKADIVGGYGGEKGGSGVGCNLKKHLTPPC